MTHRRANWNGAPTAAGVPCTTYKRNAETRQALPQIKVQLYLYLSEQRHFCFDISLASTPQHCPCSKMIEPTQRSGFYHEFVFHPPWLKCRPSLWSENTRVKRRWRKRGGRGKKHYTNCLGLRLCFKWLCGCATVCDAPLSDGGLLTCRDREKADCTVTLPHHPTPLPLGRSEKNKERERDVGVLCITLHTCAHTSTHMLTHTQTKSIHSNDREWMYRSWKCTCHYHHDPSLSNGYTVTNVPSVRHLRAIILVHSCMYNLRYGIYSFLLSSHTWTGSMSRDTPTQQSFDWVWKNMIKPKQ